MEEQGLRSRCRPLPWVFVLQPIPPSSAILYSVLLKPPTALSFRGALRPPGSPLPIPAWVIQCSPSARSQADCQPASGSSASARSRTAGATVAPERSAEQHHAIWYPGGTHEAPSRFVICCKLLILLVSRVGIEPT